MIESQKVEMKVWSMSQKLRTNQSKGIKYETKSQRYKIKSLKFETESKNYEI